MVFVGTSVLVMFFHEKDLEKKKKKESHEQNCMGKEKGAIMHASKKNGIGQRESHLQGICSYPFLKK